MLLVVFEKFSKWLELAAVRKATTDIVIKVLREQLLKRYGAPKKLISDNVHFTNNKFKAELQKWGIGYQLTTPYTPQENQDINGNQGQHVGINRIYPCVYIIRAGNTTTWKPVQRNHTRIRNGEGDDRATITTDYRNKQVGTSEHWKSSTISSQGV